MTRITAGTLVLLLTTDISCWCNWFDGSFGHVDSFRLNLPVDFSVLPRLRRFSARHRDPRLPTVLNSGYGIATNYTWKEDAYEIDLTVAIPPGTKAKDVRFKATSTSIALRVATKAASTGDVETVMTVLDPQRALRGRINVDGTYWVISDPDETDENDRRQPPSPPGSRRVTITIEKMIAAAMDDFAVVDYDWKGIYRTEDTGEVTERKYDVAESLDVREYAARMGVDIDNINMSMVDKTMFNSGLNMSQRALDELNQAGYLSSQEVTQQADGTEYVVNPDGEPIPFSPTNTGDEIRKPIPFVDTDSPWNKPKTEASFKHENETIVQQKRNFTLAAFAEDSAKPAGRDTDNPFKKSKQTMTQDPIDSLTVVRLKEILKAQGLKTSGNKSELQERLRSKVNALMQGNPQDPLA